MNFSSKFSMIFLVIYVIRLSKQYYTNGHINYMDNAINNENDLKYSGSLGCYLCSQLMSITQSKMALNQVQLKNILNERCNDLSNFIKAQCFTFVRESLPQIYYSLSYDISHKNICEMLNICEINKFNNIENTSTNTDNHDKKKIFNNIHSTVIKPIPIVEESKKTNDMEDEKIGKSIRILPKKNIISTTILPETIIDKNLNNKEKTISNNSNNLEINYMTQEKIVSGKITERLQSKIKKPKTVVYVPSDIKSEAKIPEFEDLTNPAKIDMKGMRMTCLFCEKMLNNAKNYAISAKTEISNFANNTCAKLTKSALSEECYKLTDRKISELANFVDEQVVEALWCAQMNNC
ncbi:Saposin B domain and Saposin-like domain-containing protein [Strongyloides ratti]|uniref:Saposin B domain and Saposin-like domain-containing protein n=1 Tax=Strongyloides ratti TaxID=34506 RepID=A0A090KTK7_STRRB|nr:Saposin B domain and Saposin-like domain-containing protein [Strongyloides ratti]CEF60850.1 Saposin B domain and Saposin-like domain-containing protein [Strongyloides ratti]